MLLLWHSVLQMLRLQMWGWTLMRGHMLHGTLSLLMADFTLSSMGVPLRRRGLRSLHAVRLVAGMRAWMGQYNVGET